MARLYDSWLPGSEDTLRWQACQKHSNDSEPSRSLSSSFGVPRRAHYIPEGAGLQTRSSLTDQADRFLEAQNITNLGKNSEEETPRNRSDSQKMVLNATYATTSATLPLTVTSLQEAPEMQELRHVRARHWRVQKQTNRPGTFCLVCRHTASSG